MGGSGQTEAQCNEQMNALSVGGKSVRLRLFHLAGVQLGGIGRIVLAIALALASAGKASAGVSFGERRGPLPAVSVKLRVGPDDYRYVVVDFQGRPMPNISAPWAGQCAGGYVVIGSGPCHDRDYQVADWLGRTCLPESIKSKPWLSGGGLALVLKTGRVYDLALRRSLEEPAGYRYSVPIFRGRMYKVKRVRGIGRNVVEDGGLLLKEDVQKSVLLGGGWLMSRAVEDGPWRLRRRRIGMKADLPKDVYNAIVYLPYSLIVLYREAKGERWSEIRSLEDLEVVLVRGSYIRGQEGVHWPEMETGRFLIVGEGPDELRCYDMHSLTFRSRWKVRDMSSRGYLSGHVFCWAEQDGERKICDVVSGRVVSVDQAGGGVVSGDLRPFSAGTLVAVRRREGGEFVQVCSIVNNEGSLSLQPVPLRTMLGLPEDWLSPP